MNKKIGRNNNRYWRWIKGSRGGATITNNNKRIQTKSYCRQGWTKGSGRVTSIVEDEQGEEAVTTKKYDRGITRTWRRLPIENSKNGTIITSWGSLIKK
jgi:hypothetical protein